MATRESESVALFYGTVFWEDQVGDPEVSSMTRESHLVLREEESHRTPPVCPIPAPDYTLCSPHSSTSGFREHNTN